MADPEKLQAYAEHVMGFMSGGMVSGLNWLGDHLGLYSAMAGAGPLTSAELAQKTGLRERWVREWLLQQAAAGMIDHLGGQRFELNEEQAIVMTDETHPAFMGGVFGQLLALLENAKELPESFRTGRGRSFDDLGPVHTAGMARFLDAWMHGNLLSNVLPAAKDVVAKLRSGAAVADVGCGTGTSLLLMARAFPESEFHGYDNSTHAIEGARAAGSDVPNAEFHLVRAEGLPESRFDLITTFDVVHDTTNPAGVVTGIARALKPDGTWIVSDINGFATPEENLEKHELAHVLYGFSVMCCMSAGLSEPDGAGLGTLGWHEGVAREMAADAGLKDFRRLELDPPHPLNHFYEVRR